MNKKIILISTALLISNLGFAYDVKTLRAIDAPITQNIVYDINNGVSASLISKGLDVKVAKELSRNVFSANASSANIMVQNLQDGCKGIELSHITQYVATKALHREQVDFSSYDTLVGLVQTQKSLHVDSEVLTSLQKIAKKNKEILYTV